jgi:hypothetical protein
VLTQFHRRCGGEAPRSVSDLRHGRREAVGSSLPRRAPDEGAVRLVVRGGDDRDAVAIRFLPDRRLVVGVEPCPAQLHLAACLGKIAKPCTPADAVPSFEDGHAMTAFAQIPRGHQAGEPGADHEDVEGVCHVNSHLLRRH